MRRAILTAFIATSCTSYAPDDAIKQSLPVMPKEASSANGISHTLYMIKAGRCEDAIDAMLARKQEDAYLYHEGALEELGLALLERGASENTPEDIVTTLYGVGISRDDRALVLAEKAGRYEDPQMQLIALSVAAGFDTDAAFSCIERAMRSNFVVVRLEAAYILATKRKEGAFEQLHALMAKVDPELRELFPRLFAIEGSERSLKELRRLLYDENELVRREAILAAGITGRDEFCEDIRTLAKESSSVQQEAASFALGLFGDEASRPLLEKLAKSHTTSVRLAACRALYQLGSIEYKTYIVEEAAKKDPFAISMLGAFDGADGMLLQLMNDDDVTVRSNAAMALLHRKDPRALQAIADILIDLPQDYSYRIVTSHGGALQAIQATPNARQLFARHPQFFEVSLKFKEQVLVKALELHEEDFLALAEAIFMEHQYDLIPLLVRLLENLHSEKAIALLKAQEQRLGAPYIRAWCCLALYRLDQPGPYADTMRKMIEKHEDKELFKARQILPWKMRQDDTRYELTLEQSCALLIESFEALSERQDEKAIELLLKIIRDGNVHNRYTLAGLLMRSSQ